MNVINNNKLSRVVFLCDFFSSYGGTEYYNALLAECLIKNGISVRIYIGERPRQSYWVNRLNALGVEYKYPKKFHTDLEDDEIEKNFIAEIITEINDWKPAVIHVHPFKKMAINWLINSDSDKKIPIVATEWTIPHPIAAHWFDYRTKKYINNVSAYIATCNEVAKSIPEYHDYKGRVVHIPHLIYPSIVNILRMPENIESVGCIARLSPEKGVDILINAWSIVSKKHPKAILHLYGLGPEYKSLKLLSETLGLKNNIIFEGTYPPFAGIDTVAARHKIFVQPSLFETIPTSLIELMLRGRVMIATDVGGVHELINEQTGLLIPSNNINKLAETIDGLLSNTNDLARIGEQAKSFASDIYDLENITKDIIKLFEEVSIST